MFEQSSLSFTPVVDFSTDEVVKNRHPEVEGSKVQHHGENLIKTFEEKMT